MGVMETHLFPLARKLVRNAPGNAALPGQAIALAITRKGPPPGPGILQRRQQKFGGRG